MSEGFYEVIGGDSKIITEGTEGEGVEGKARAHEANDGVKGEGEEDHGEGAALFDSGGEEDGGEDFLVEHDVVEVVSVKLFDDVYYVGGEQGGMQGAKRCKHERGRGRQLSGRRR